MSAPYPSAPYHISSRTRSCAVKMTAAALPSSKLGTQEHWDSVYAREVKNFDELGDKGEVWCV